jgi:hypothetical protein
VVGLLAACLVIAQTCQKDQVRLTKDQAVAKAREQITFAPDRTQVRLLRQGLGARPHWVVSMSVASRRDPGLNAQEFRKLAVVSIDANTGKVIEVRVQR